MAEDLEAAVTTVAAASAAGRDPVALVGPDPADLDIIPIIPLWADGIGTGPGVTMAAVAAVWEV